MTSREQSFRGKSSTSVDAEAAPLGHDPLNPWAVRRWARSSGIPASEFRNAYRPSFRLSLARLVQALYRERLCAAQLFEHASLGTCVSLGSPPELLIPVTEKIFARIDVREEPACYDGSSTPIRSAGVFLRRLRTVLAGTPLAPYRANLALDFKNSVSSLALGRLLASRAGVLERALEPAWQGHHYYPFPGLRLGPAVEHVVACSQLSANAVEVPLLEVASLRFRSAVFGSARECLAASVGLPLDSDAVIPVHPWQLAISPVVAALLEAGAVRVLERKLACKPLASQRTLRACATRYDFKLSVDASITSEHRLIFRLNGENAPAISALVRRLVEGSDVRERFGIQQDAASLSFDDPELAPHLSAIVRAPVRARGEKIVSAINLWTGPELALQLLRGAAREDVKRFFTEYARVMLQGPLAFLLHHGIAFEPHLQNSLLALKGGRPRRLILRDLDGTLMARSRVEPLVREAGLTLAPDTWEHMPASEIGEHRLLHALFFGHLLEAIELLARSFGIAEEELLHSLAEVWWQMPRALGVPAARLEALGAHFDRGKQMLLARAERRTKMAFVPLPTTARSIRELSLFQRRPR